MNRSSPPPAADGQAAAQMYREIFESAGDAIFVLDAVTGAILDVNRTMLGMFDYDTKEEVLRLTIRDLSAELPPYTTVGAIERMLSAATEMPQVFEWLARKRNETTFWVEISLHALTLSGTSRIIAMVRDIDDRKTAEQALRESENSFRTLFEESADPILLLDEGRFIDCNAAAVAILRCPSKAAVVGRTPWDFSPAAQPDGRPSHEKAEAMIREALDRGFHRFEWMHSAIDGAPVPVEVMLTPITFKGRRIFHTVWRDIADRLKAEDALRISTATYQGIINSITEAVYIQDADGNFLDVNRAAEAMYGYPREAFIGRSPAFLSAPDRNDVAAVGRAVQAAFEGTPGRFQFWGRRSNGEIFPKDVSVTPGIYFGKRVVIAVSRDITDRIRAEEALQESEEVFHQFLEHSPIYVFFKDEQIRSTLLSRNFESMLGRPLEELIGKSMFDLFPSPFAAAMVEDDKRILHEGRRITVEEEFNGRFYSTIKFPIEIPGKPRQLAGFTIDITERKRSEQILAESENRFRLVWQNSLDAMRLADKDGTILMVNDAFCRLFSKTRKELEGTSIADLHGPEFRAGVLEAYRKRFSEGTVAPHYEGHIHTWDGRDLYVEGGHTFLSIPDQPRLLLSVLRDISDRRQAEESLRKSEAQYRYLIETIPDGVYRSTHDGRFLEINPAMVRILGYGSREELMGIDIKTQLYFAEGDRESAALEEKFEEMAVFRLRKKDGSEVWVEDHGRHVLDEAGNILYHEGIMRDVTERLRMEDERLKTAQQIQQTQRLESLGLLAGGIAHDFNNLLGGMFGYVELARSAAESGDLRQTSDRLAKALQAFTRAKDLTRQLLTFAKGGAPARAPGDLARTVTETAQFALSGSNVKAEFDLDPALHACSYDPNQIGQVIDNIVINAKHAMPQGGVLAISARNLQLAHDAAAGLPDGPYIRVSIKDHGIGIPSEYVQKIFDPFFTTKQAGSGLGLATAWSIIKRHDGTILVESEPGKGSTFHIYLPALAGNAVISETDASEPFTCRGRILVMDDEEAIRDILSEMLRSIGFTVASAVDGADAVDQFIRARIEGRPFDAVLADLTIPGGVGGLETLRRLQMVDRNVCVIASSGYSEDPIMSAPADHGFAASIRKPFRTADVRNTMRQVVAALRREQDRSDTPTG